MSNAKSSGQNVTVSDHLGILTKLSQLATETNNDNEKRLEDLKKELEDLKCKVDIQQKKCEQSKKRMQDAKIELEQAEKTLEVIDLAAEDEIDGGEQSRWDKRRRLMLTESPTSSPTFRISDGSTREQLKKKLKKRIPTMTEEQAEIVAARIDELWAT
jgi:TolA-binding protein